MNYLISKNKGDGRVTICGVIIPDNFFVVMGLTFDNQLQIKHVQGIDNYDVTPTDLPEGHYTPEGYRVDKWSIRDWAYEKGKLVYLDKDPVEVVTAPDRSGIRPPDVSKRPDHIDIDSIPESEVVLPPAVAKARALIEQQDAEGITPLSAPTRADAGAAESAEISQESDEATLAAAGATDEIAMLRAQLDARNIKYHPTAKAPALRKKLG